MEALLSHGVGACNLVVGISCITRLKAWWPYRKLLLVLCCVRPNDLIRKTWHTIHRERDRRNQGLNHVMSHQKHMLIYFGKGKSSTTRPAYRMHGGIEHSDDAQGSPSYGDSESRAMGCLSPCEVLCMAYCRFHFTRKTWRTAHRRFSSGSRRVLCDRLSAIGFIMTIQAFRYSL
jgi:hypothetical protein